MAAAGEGMLKASDYRVRAVCATDTARCKEIAAATYGGRDYLLAALERWQANPDTYIVKCLAHPDTDELCALEAVGKVDGGVTGWLEGLRTHPDHRRRGLARRIQHVLVGKCLSQARSGGSTIRRLRYTTRSDNAASIAIGEACGLSVTATWGFLFKSDAERLASALTDIAEEQASAALAGPPAAFSHLCKAAPAEVATMLTCANTSSGDVPALERVMADWKVHELGDEAESTLQQLVETVGAEIVVGDGALSLGQMRPDVSSASWCVTVSSRGELLPAVRHLLWHCHRAREHKVDCMMIFFDHTLVPELGNDSKLNTVADIFPGADTCVLLERDLSLDEPSSLEAAVGSVSSKD